MRSKYASNILKKIFLARTRTKFIEERALHISLSVAKNGRQRKSHEFNQTSKTKLQRQQQQPAANSTCFARREQREKGTHPILLFLLRILSLSASGTVLLLFSKVATTADNWSRSYHARSHYSQNSNFASNRDREGDRVSQNPLRPASKSLPVDASNSAEIAVLQQFPRNNPKITRARTRTPPLPQISSSIFAYPHFLRKEQQ